MSVAQIIEADLTWTGAAFEPGVRVRIGEDGRITDVGAFSAPPTRRLRGRALLPGFVNAHSHAFQRGLRGKGERFPDGAGSFWTWREAMYELVRSMDEERALALSLRAFREMRAAGVTTVGEFHYLHHADDLDWEFDRVVLRAAREVGIRIVLLNTYYRTGDIGHPLQGGQRRFDGRSLDEFWAAHDRLKSIIDPSTQSLGVAAHSIRAVPLDELITLHAESARRGLVFHMHVEEQPREVESCVGHYGATPMRLLADNLPPDSRLTSVHCTHSSAEDLERYLATGAGVCICPLTEANLADGVGDVPEWLKREARVCFGTDSNARISMIEEMRWMEYVQRLHRERRGVCVDSRGRNARTLLCMATRNGADSLGIQAGRIEPGCHGDFVAIDLEAASLSGWEADTLLESTVCGCDNSVIAGTCVGGVWDTP